MSSSAGGGDPSVVQEQPWLNAVNASNAQTQAAQELKALFGLPTYSGLGTNGVNYSGQLKPGTDFMVRRLMQARNNETVTDAFKPKSYMPSWAVQQPAAQWVGGRGIAERPLPASYFPGIANVSGGSKGTGTNLGFGTVFGSLAPSAQIAGGGAPVIPENNGVNTGTVTPPVYPSYPPGTTPGYPPGFNPGTQPPSTEGWMPGPATSQVSPGTLSGFRFQNAAPGSVEANYNAIAGRYGANDAINYLMRNGNNGGQRSAFESSLRAGGMSDQDVARIVNQFSAGGSGGIFNNGLSGFNGGVYSNGTDQVGLLASLGIQDTSARDALSAFINRNRRQG